MRSATVISWMALASTFACGSESAKPSAAAPAPSSTAPVASALPGEPPPEPNAPRAGTTRNVFAVRALFLGDSALDGTVSEFAWQQFGYDLDAKDTTRESSDVCAAAAGASTRIQEDGPDGLDNSFGRTLLPVLSRMKGQSVSLETSQYMQTADATLFDVIGLDGSPEQSNTGLSLSVWHGARRVDAKAVPDRWSVDPVSARDGATITSGAKHTFENAYVSAGIVVARGTSPLDVAFPMGAGELIQLRIHRPMVTFRHAEAGVADEGRVTGVLDPTELLPELQRGLKLWQPATCSTGTELAFLETMVAQAVDMQLDASNAPGATCTGISIGLGFRATTTDTPTDVAAAREKRTDPCD